MIGRLTDGGKRTGGLVRERTWKRAVPRLLALRGKAVVKCMPSIVTIFANLNTEEAQWMEDYLADGHTINDFLHGRGQVIDAVWITLVVNIHDGNAKTVKGLFEIFIKGIIDESKGVCNRALSTIKRQSEAIDRGDYTEEEAHTAKTELANAGKAIQAVQKILVADNEATISKHGLEYPINTDNQPLIPALQSRMRHNILDVSGIRGGLRTKDPVPPPPGETKASALEKIKGADPARTASPDSKRKKHATTKPGPGRPRKDGGPKKSDTVKEEYYYDDEADGNFAGGIHDAGTEDDK
jgi:hypothetical protein